MTLRAIMVCVDYADLLSITLPYNRHHFSEVMVVSAPTASDLHLTSALCARYSAALHLTDAFYRDGADFNKWRALEEGLDVFGRRGWMCIMDADVLWPYNIECWAGVPLDCGGDLLVSPMRRMLVDLTKLYYHGDFAHCRAYPPESDWASLPIHPNTAEFAGYTQIFHAGCKFLGVPPWHEVNWRHAGGADSFFQARWPPSHKRRPNWEVLHLGPAGENWCGRASPLTYFDTSGTGLGAIGPPSNAEAGRRRERLKDMLSRRKRGAGRFDAEKLP